MAKKSRKQKIRIPGQERFQRSKPDDNRELKEQVEWLTRRINEIDGKLNHTINSILFQTDVRSQALERVLADKKIIESKEEYEKLLRSIGETILKAAGEGAKKMEELNKMQNQLNQAKSSVPQEEMDEDIIHKQFKKSETLDKLLE